MRLSNLVYAAIGYTLGARAGRERYEDIVRLARRVAGSQTVQSTAGVVQGRFDQYASQARQLVAAKFSGNRSSGRSNGVNGHQS
ncbi:MAG TPA: hypothetical protein VFH38_08085 [Jatrophihabitans sp.]|nr:hypothetical protein [Jatrophihabitans sp.]